ncbi:MAG: glycosyltransferase [Anaerolineae bacterium]
MTLHILHITPYYAPAYAFGGVVSAVQGLAEATAASGARVTVVTTDALNHAGERAQPESEMLNGVKVVRVANVLPSLRTRFNLSTPRRFGSVADFMLRSADVLHLHEFRTVEALIASHRAVKRGVPIVLSPHGTLTHSTGRSALKRRWDRWFSPYVAQRVDAVVALSEAEAADVRALWAQFWPRQHPLPIHIVPNGVNLAAFADLPDPAPFRAQWGLGTDRVVLYMGRLHPRKGADRLAAAFQQADLPQARLLIVGPDEGLRDALLALNDPRIVLTGYLSGADRLTALACADVFALPAVGEGLPMTALEAMACGVPVILSHGCNLPEAAAAGAGLVTDPTPEAFCAALHTLLNDDALRQRMSAAARRLVSERFTWGRVVAQMEQVYAQVRSLNKG